VCISKCSLHYTPATQNMIIIPWLLLVLHQTAFLNQQVGRHKSVNPWHTGLLCHCVKMWCAQTAALYTFCCCQFHSSLPLVPLLNEINPVPTLPTYFFKIHFNIILPSMPMSSKCSFTFRFHLLVLGWMQYLLYYVDHNLQCFLENTV